MQGKIIISFLIAGLILSCCKKNNNQGQGEDCYNFPSSSSPFGYTLQSAPQLFGDGYYNPINNNQITYTVDASDTYAIYTMNLQTIQSVLLCSGPYLLPKWSSTGWIVLTSLDGNIYKIKPDGSSFTKIPVYDSSGLLATCASWSPNGNKIVFNGATHKWSGMYIMNADGSGLKILDSIKTANYPAWSQDGSKIVYFVGDVDGFIGYYDTVNNQNINLSSSGQTGTKSFAWFPDSKTIIWSSDDGLYKMDISTQQVTQLRTNCDSRGYGNPCVSSDGNHILVNRADSKIIQPNTHYTETHIWVMDANGNNETEIK